MNARRISSAVILTTGIWCTPQHLHGQSADAHAYAAFSAVEVVREHRYQVDARMRPFLVWIRESNIGDGRLTWRRGRDGTLGYELLVGSDPARTPRHINRWGYLREESGDSGSIVFGVMSQSDGQSVDDADKSHELDRWHPRVHGAATTPHRIAGAGHRLRRPRGEGPDLHGSRRAAVGGAWRALDRENGSNGPVDLTRLPRCCGQPHGSRTDCGGQSIQGAAIRPHLSVQRSPLRTAVAIRGPRRPIRARRTVVRCRDSGSVPGAEPHDRRGDAVHGLLWG